MQGGEPDAEPLGKEQELPRCPVCKEVLSCKRLLAEHFDGQAARKAADVQAWFCAVELRGEHDAQTQEESVAAGKPSSGALLPVAPTVAATPRQLGFIHVLLKKLAAPADRRQECLAEAADSICAASSVIDSLQAECKARGIDGAPRQG